jgi:beta-glucanase (GH16 family)
MREGMDRRATAPPRRGRTRAKWLLSRARLRRLSRLGIMGVAGLLVPVASAGARETGAARAGARVSGGVQATAAVSRRGVARHFGRRPRHGTTVRGTAADRQLVFSDEFTGDAGALPNSAKWSFDVGANGWGNEELQAYTPRAHNAALDGQGDLVLSARAETTSTAGFPTRGYTSARLQTLGKFQFTYGLVEARILVPSGQGLLPQFWMLGADAYKTNGWPKCGEIDAMEVLGSKPNAVAGTIHGPWAWAPHGVGAAKYAPTPLSTGFHVYGVQWSANQISFLLDGVVYETITPARLRSGSDWPFRRPNFLLLDLAVGGRWPGAPTASTSFPANMLVDWVHVWQ